MSRRLSPAQIAVLRCIADGKQWDWRAHASVVAIQTRGFAERSEEPAPPGRFGGTRRRWRLTDAGVAALADAETAPVRVRLTEQQRRCLLSIAGTGYPSGRHQTVSSLERAGLAAWAQAGGRGFWSLTDSGRQAIGRA